MHKQRRSATRLHGDDGALLWHVAARAAAAASSGETFFESWRETERCMLAASSPDQRVEAACHVWKGRAGEAGGGALYRATSQTPPFLVWVRPWGGVGAQPLR